jgi:hypothetical protein
MPLRAKQRRRVGLVISVVGVGLLVFAALLTNALGLHGGQIFGGARGLCSAVVGVALQRHADGP